MHIIDCGAQQFAEESVLCFPLNRNISSGIQLHLVKEVELEVTFKRADQTLYNHGMEFGKLVTDTRSVWSKCHKHPLTNVTQFLFGA